MTSQRRSASWAALLIDARSATWDVMWRWTTWLAAAWQSAPCAGRRRAAMALRRRLRRQRRGQRGRADHRRRASASARRRCRECLGVRRHADGELRIDELVTAVGNALAGCPPDADRHAAPCRQTLADQPDRRRMPPTRPPRTPTATPTAAAGGRHLARGAAGGDRHRPVRRSLTDDVRRRSGVAAAVRRRPSRWSAKPPSPSRTAPGHASTARSSATARSASPIRPPATQPDGCTVELTASAVIPAGDEPDHRRVHLRRRLLRRVLPDRGLHHRGGRAPGRGSVEPACAGRVRSRLRAVVAARRRHTPAQRSASASRQRACASRHSGTQPALPREDQPQDDAR